MQVAGTVDGVKEPTATFSACFGAAFIMLHPTKYAAMLADKMKRHGATAWLVNTGWTGGRYIFKAHEFSTRLGSKIVCYLFLYVVGLGTLVSVICSLTNN